MPWKQEYIYKDGKSLRKGYTTGTCAAAAAQAAVRLLLGEQSIQKVSLTVPAGETLSLKVLNPHKRDGWAKAAIQKDSGDDPDSTNGVLVYAEARWCQQPGIWIQGGKGIGRVTKSGLECPIGAPAINRVPREMILQQVQGVLEQGEPKAPGVQITLSIPDGERLAKKTYNPRLGIEGGLSILGTSGIVEPMSEKALLDTIYLEMKLLHTGGKKSIILTPGNYGETFLKKQFGKSVEAAVKCSNFIGQSLDYAVEFGFQQILLVGHIGKFVKLAGGIMDTHSHTADCRMELFLAHAALIGAKQPLYSELMNCITTEEAIDLLKRDGIEKPVMESLLKQMVFHVESRVWHQPEIGIILFSNRHGLLAQTENAKTILAQIEEQRTSGGTKNVGTD